jgi:hypothetical protein
MRASVRFRGNWSFIDNPIPQEKRRVGVRQGSLVRTIARRAIRRRKRPSMPGESPTNQTGLLKKFLFYSWDGATQSVLIGPEKLPGAYGEVPKVLEFGGEKIAARPYMAPSLNAAMAKLPELWNGAIK